MAKAPESGKPTKEEKKAIKVAKKAAGKERRGQIWQAFQMQRKEDKKLVPYMILAILVTTAVIWVLLSVLLDVAIYFSIPMGVLLGALVAMILFSRRVQASVYKKAEDTPGAGAWSLQNNLRGKWRITPAVSATTQLDAVHRVVGRPGVILVAEGAPHRVKPLLAQEKKRTSRIVGESVPIYDIIIGKEEGQTPLAKLNRQLIKLPRNISAAEVTTLDNKLTALAGRAPQAGLPKGPMPQGAKMRSPQRSARRR